MNIMSKVCILLLTSLFLVACTLSESPIDSDFQKAQAAQLQASDEILEQTMSQAGQTSKNEAEKIILPNENRSENANASENESANENTNAEEEKTPPPTKEEELLQSMSIEEKIGQLFMYAFRGKNTETFTEDMRHVIQTYQPGGVILFPENIKSQEQVRKLIRDFQSATKIPLFISVDEEGGRVVRVGNIMDGAAPSAAAIGKENNVELAFENGSKIGRDLYSLGFNMDFAPVADINTNPKNVVIGDRAFGSDPEQVGTMVESTVKGLKSENILTVLKHFPGHGDTAEDSHKGMAVITHDLQRLKESELIPFVKGIEAGADFVLVGHISAPNILPTNEPAIFSKELLTDLLRNEMGFEGLIITDAMDMGAITNYYHPGDAAVKAFLAGNDIILMPDNIEAAYNSMLEAYEQGIISLEQIEQSVARILKTKSNF